VVQANTETDIILSILIEGNGSLDEGRLARNLQEEWLSCSSTKALWTILMAYNYLEFVHKASQQLMIVFRGGAW